MIYPKDLERIPPFQGIIPAGNFFSSKFPAYRDSDFRDDRSLKSFPAKFTFMEN